MADGESVQRLTSDLTSPIEMLEVVAAIVVTAGLVAGNLLLFSPLRIDNRIKALQHLQLNLRTQLAQYLGERL